MAEYTVKIKGKTYTVKTHKYRGTWFASTTYGGKKIEALGETEEQAILHLKAKIRLP